jgi:hypothetical protein
MGLKLRSKNVEYGIKDLKIFMRILTFPRSAEDNFDQKDLSE